MRKKRIASVLLLLVLLIGCLPMHAFAEELGRTGETGAVRAAGAAAVTFVTDPSDAIVFVRDADGRHVLPGAGGTYSLTGGAEYTYNVTRYGYHGYSGSFTAADGDVVNVLLTPSTASAIEAQAYWKNFRNSDVNMAITDVETPRDPEHTRLIWNHKFSGSGWTAAPSIQIIVEDGLMVMSNKVLYKLDLKTGEVLAQADMVAAPNWGYTPMTYAEGMIFCPLKDGTIQAFNAKTLESLWVYQDALKGQSLCPITYADGYIYTGFWNGDNKRANYVCLSVTDEDPVTPDEEKIPTWIITDGGGYYWAGAVVLGDAVIFGDCATEHTLRSVDRLTGEILSTLDTEGLGHIRSSIAYADGRIYFTGQDGYLASAAVASDGTLSDLKSAALGAATTSTPVVYDGKVYIGAGKMWTGGSGGNFLVCDADTLEVLYSKELLGYPQCSMLLSTAYLEEEGKLYFYSTYNVQPGGITLIKVDPDGTTEDAAEVVEVYDAAGFEQYCITSIICGPDGTLYYKNDSSNVFAVREALEIELEAELVNGGVKLAWSAPRGAGTYEVLRRTGNGGWEKIAETDGNEYTDESVGVLTDYAYLVEASKAVSNAAEIATGRFLDVLPGDSWNKAVDWAVEQGIVNGTSSTTFSPKAACTRAQFALMLYRMAGKPAVDMSTNPFTDLPDNAGIRRAIVWAYNEGIVNGTSATTYSPNNNITRAQLTIMLYKMAGKPSVAGLECPFEDLEGLSSNNVKAITWAYNEGIVKGTGATTFGPKANCTRGQLVIMLYRYNKLFNLVPMSAGPAANGEA